MMFFWLVMVSFSCRSVDKDNEGTIITQDDADPALMDIDGDGFTGSEDCNDSDATIKPDADEICDGIDNDCNGKIDDEDENLIDGQHFYVDEDGDGFGNLDITLIRCTQPFGYVDNADDCDDNSTEVSPEGTEICDELDNNCDGTIDEATAIDATTWYQDNDEDGFGNSDQTETSCTMPVGYADNALDCDDLASDIHPNASEICNTVDDNCDGTIDEDTAIDATTWYQDNDVDGYGDSTQTMAACSQPIGFVSNNTDCNDENALQSPDITEQCNEIDDNCDGTIDEDTAIDATTWYQDNDVDGYGDSTQSMVTCNQPQGYVVSSTDCDDNDPLRSPGTVEQCNGIDDNCDGTIDENTAIDATTWYEDSDADGHGDASSALVQCTAPTDWINSGGDCNDNDASIYPGAAEGCANEDQNCDGLIDNDADLDGYSASSCGGYDCNDNDASIYPNAGDCYFRNCQEILIAGFSQGDGLYTIDPDGSFQGNAAFSAQCDMTTDDGGWTIIDSDLTPEWSNHFATWSNWGSNFAGPSGYPSTYSWRSWFTLDDTTTEYRRSEDCTNIESANSSEVYRMTGDHYGCVWYNGNCPMTGDTCNECTNPYGTVNSGSCWHLGYSPDADYNPAEGPSWTCGNHWWNNAPSIGTSGSYCVAYR